MSMCVSADIDGETQQNASGSESGPAIEMSQFGRRKSKKAPCKTENMALHYIIIL